MQIGIIGYGYWGPNITRNFMHQPGCTVKTIADANPERLEMVRGQFPEVRATENADDIFNDNGIDAVAIVSPVSTHYDFAKRALQNGKHVLVEKPITTNSAEVSELISLAAKNKKVLMVDHTFLYTGAVEKIKQLIDNGEIGKINYIDSTRINLGIFQQDVNVLWDLASHDLSVVCYLLKEKPISVQAIGVSHTDNKIENIAYLTLHYQSGMIVHVSCSWTSPVKIRSLLIGGDKKMILYNDIEPTDKIKIYDSGFTVKTNEDKRNVLVDYRLGDVTIPKIPMKEALSGVVKDFYEAVTQNKQPRSGAELGLEVVKILEHADKSLAQRGAEVMIKW